MAGCEQLAGELKVLEDLLKKTSIEHKRREIIDRIDQIKAEQQETWLFRDWKVTVGQRTPTGRD